MIIPGSHSGNKESEERYAETRETWNKVAALYEEKFMDLGLYDSTYDRFCQLLKKQRRLLELGCGPGNITRYIFARRPDLQILATDASPEMIRLAAKNNPGVRCEVLDARNLSEMNETFDGIIAGFCLPYLCAEDAEKMMENAHRLLGRDGLLYISTLDGDYSRSAYEEGVSGRVFVHYYSIDNLVRMLARTGFMLQYECKVPFERREKTETHIVVIAKKRRPS